MFFDIISGQHKSQYEEVLEVITADEWKVQKFSKLDGFDAFDNFKLDGFESFENLERMMPYHTNKPTYHMKVSI
jgi:hypothetical protein